MKINHKVYDAINWLNKNLKADTVRYLERETRSDIETWSIDRVLSKAHFYGRSIQKMCSEIMVNSPKQPMNTRNSFDPKLC